MAASRCIEEKSTRAALAAPGYPPASCGVPRGYATDTYHVLNVDHSSSDSSNMCVKLSWLALSMARLTLSPSMELF